MNPLLATEYRQEIRRFVRGETSLDTFRSWFVAADQRAHHGFLAGTSDPHVVAMSNEIWTALSDLDDGFITGAALVHAVAAIESSPRDLVLADSRDHAARLYPPIEGRKMTGSP